MSERFLVCVQSCYSKSHVASRILCSVCCCYRSLELFSTDYCCSTLSKHNIRQICDTCIHEYIVSVLRSCLSSSIVCPELNCRAHLSPIVICHSLLKYEDNHLLNDYLREQQWHGKSEEWIKRFTLQCPGCNVPIEKNGGCDQIICSRCHLHFYWSTANRNDRSSKETDQQSSYINHSLVTYLIFVIVVLFVVCIFIRHE